MMSNNLQEPAGRKKSSASSAPTKPGEKREKASQATSLGKPAASGRRFAVVLVRGYICTAPQTKKALFTLRLLKKNVCIVRQDSRELRGMLLRVKDYVTWGELDDETYKLLVEKRSEKDPKDSSKIKPFFRLNPPRRGFGRKGIKTSFSAGGALGYRKDKINDLIRRMI